MKTQLYPLLGILLLCSMMSTAQENLWSSGRPDGHAPISVMGDHYHKKGEFMLSYRYMPMWMKGNLSSSSDISNAAIFQNFMVAPQKMRMDMHMLGAMYAPSDKLTVMVMGNYIKNSMDLQMMSGMTFSTESSGFGDISLGAIYKILNKKRQSVHANFGLSIPTGDIDQRGDTPMMSNAQLAYPMQLGSGTWDPYFGATYLGQADTFSWGAQTLYKVRLGDNSENYSFGNKFDLTGWFAYKLSKNVSVSASASYMNIGSISGSDADLNPMMMPLFNSANSGRNQLDLGLGANYYIAEGTFKDLRFGAEFKFPISQSVTGIQMKNQAIAVFGIQYAIGH